ncbi:MAG: class I SAM-dependent rRNA methyltransferase, partial [Fibrobacterota bacterium]
QRDNRSLLRSYSAGARVCDCFSYSGGFAVNALLGGAQKVTAVDISRNAGEWVRANAQLSGLGQALEFTTADVFKYLRECEDSYNLLVLDPPKFAKHPGEVERAARGYKDINMVGLKRLEPGGLLFTFSCSNAVDPYLFRQIVFSAAADANRPVQLLHLLSAGPDHPVNIAHREGEYLKGLVLRVAQD